MPFVMPSVQVDVDTSIGILIMRDRASCNPLAYSIGPNPKNLCRLRHRVSLRPRCVLFRHALRHALIMPAVLGILPLPEAFALVRAILVRVKGFYRGGSPCSLMAAKREAP